MNATPILRALTWIAVSGLLISASQAQAPGLTRHDLQRHDLSVPGREVVQVRIDFAPNAYGPPHIHPGEEIIYVLSGTLDYEIAGQAPVRATAGDVLFVPAGAVHSARNVGDGGASELATYIVEKGQPLLVPAP
jgi:quercetin dioxygenase-like cupin family protein